MLAVENIFLIKYYIKSIYSVLKQPDVDVNLLELERDSLKNVT